MDQMMDTAAAAQYLHISPSTMNKWRLTGEGPRWCKVGMRRIVYRLADLDSWIASRLSAA